MNALEETRAIKRQYEESLVTHHRHTGESLAETKGAVKALRRVEEILVEKLPDFARRIEGEQDIRKLRKFILCLVKFKLRIYSEDNIRIDFFEGNIETSRKVTLLGLYREITEEWKEGESLKWK